MSSQEQQSQRQQTFNQIIQATTATARLSWFYLPLVVIILLIIGGFLFSVSRNKKIILIISLFSISILTLAGFGFIGIDASNFNERMLVQFGLPLVTWLTLVRSIVLLFVEEKVSEELKLDE